MAQTITQDLGKNVAGGLLRRLPLGNTIANSVVGEDPRYSYKMTPAQIEKAWEQVQIHFRECPTCLRIVCLSDFDAQSGYCNEDSPRKEQIAEAEGQQAGAALRGLASAFGLGDVAKKVEQAVKQASTGLATCPNDGTTAPAGTKFCPGAARPCSSRPRPPCAPPAAPRPRAPSSARNAAPAWKPAPPTALRAERKPKGPNSAPSAAPKSAKKTARQPEEPPSPGFLFFNLRLE